MNITVDKPRKTCYLTTEEELTLFDELESQLCYIEFINDSFLVLRKLLGRSIIAANPSFLLFYLMMIYDMILYSNNTGLIDKCWVI